MCAFKPNPNSFEIGWGTNNIDNLSDKGTQATTN
jgi:hypothetical protein